MGYGQVSMDLARFEAFVRNGARYLVVAGGRDVLEAYLPGGTPFLQPYEGYDVFVAVTLPSNTRYVVDRLASGLHTAVVCESLDEADAEVMRRIALLV